MPQEDRLEYMHNEKMLISVLRAKEKAWGPENLTTLDTVNDLAILYASHGNTISAKEMYVRALQGYEKTRGIDHPKSREVTRNLESLGPRIM
jgi:hypothetical protein